jgi:hypothetical protein
LLAHDLVRKPVPTFRDHALAPEKAAPKHFFARGGRTIAAPPGPINGWGLSLYVGVLHLNPAGSLSPAASPG